MVCGEPTQRSLAVYVCNENLNIPVFFHPRARPVMLPGSVGFACSECCCQLPWQPCHRARGCPRLWLFWVLMSVTMATLLQNVSFACSECWCQLPWQPCCRVRGCPRLRLFWALMSVTMATLLQSEGLPQAPTVLSADVSYHGNLVAEWGAAPGTVIFACSECWCQLPWQPCCRVRDCPRHCNLCLFWVLVSVTMTTLLQSEGLPQAL